MTAKVMKLLNSRTGLMECRYCGARHSANARHGKYLRGSWQCQHGCKHASGTKSTRSSVAAAVLLTLDAVRPVCLDGGLLLAAVQGAMAGATPTELLFALSMLADEGLIDVTAPASGRLCYGLTRSGIVHCDGTHTDTSTRVAQWRLARAIAVHAGR